MINRIRHLTPWMDDSLFEWVRASYEEEQRHYHTMVHLGEMFSLADDCGFPLMTYWPTMSAAIIFHDVVYNPKSATNEEESAFLAALRLDVEGIDPMEVSRMIIATKTHLSDDPVTQNFLDLDMAILSASRRRYIDYARDIRREYSHVNIDDYVAGRSRFIGSQLARKSIFFHEGRDDMSDRVLPLRVRSTFKAQCNLAMELGYLTADPAQFLQEK